MDEAVEELAALEEGGGEHAPVGDVTTLEDVTVLARLAANPREEE